MQWGRWCATHKDASERSDASRCRSAISWVLLRSVGERSAGDDIVLQYFAGTALPAGGLLVDADVHYVERFTE